LGLSIDNLSKILRCAGNDDVVTMRAEDEPSYIRFTFENEK
jgi:proliferating cell nuclear antigen